MDIVGLASAALTPVSAAGIPVAQGWYDDNLKRTHVTLWSLGEYEDGYADDDADVEIASIQVNIWSDRDQIDLKKQIKKLMKSSGFIYIGSNDECEPDTKIFSSALRFMRAEEINRNEEL